MACKKDNTNPSSLPLTAASIAGNFTVSSFISSTDQTALFSNYQFTFSDNGAATAVKDGVTYNGTWGFDDSDNSELKLSFSDGPLTELNKGWHIAELTSDHMLLTDDSESHENGDDNPNSHETLRFQRK